MKVLHVSPSFYPATYYGGPIYSTYALCNALAANPDLELRVLTTDTAGPHPNGRLQIENFPSRLPAGYDVYYCKRWMGADISPGLFVRLWGMIRWADVVHVTAVYSPPTIPTLMLCRLLRKPVVWSPRGSLQRLPGFTRRTAKRPWERVCNLLCDPQRVTLHVTSSIEKEASCSIIPRAGVVVIPNGVEVVPDVSHQSTDSVDLRLLYLGRLHPKKGIENLLRAIHLISRGVTLSVCGNGDPSYQRDLKSLASDLDLNGRAAFHGHVEGEVKQKEFARADVCVVPSFSENFCLVVAEALAHGVPVIASKGTPWPELETVGCGLWVDNDPESLSAAIRRMSEMPRREMGKKGREWMAREFAWSTVAEKMFALYEGLCKARS